MKKIGVLISNLGSPSALTPTAIRAYLAEFLSDPRVVPLNPLLWKIILKGFILPFRSKKSLCAYQQIWTAAGSPLTVYSEQLTSAVRTRLQTLNKNLPVVLGMRYGEPNLTNALHKLQQQDVSEVIVLPLYPQYSEVTTGSMKAAILQALASLKYKPTLSMIESYYQDPRYISALAQHVQAHWERVGKAKRLLISFHGLPQRSSLRNQDPYGQQCEVTASLLANALHLKPDEWQLVFQSRVGYAKWLQPYCAETLESLAKQGLKCVQVICPGFPVDCLETLEEIAIRNQKHFIALGGQELDYISALNVEHEHVAFLTALICDLC